MPRVSKKRRAAILRCSQRKKRAADNHPDQIRTSAAPVDPDLLAIEQPDGSIEDDYLEYETPSLPSFLPDSDSEPNIPLPPDDADDTPSNERLDAHANSIANLPPTDYDQLSLPELPSVDMFEVLWSENNPLDFPDDLPIEPSSVPSGFVCTDTPYDDNFIDDWHALRDTPLLQNDGGVDGKSASSFDADFSRDVRVEPEPLLPILATTLDSKHPSPCVSPCSISSRIQVDETGEGVYTQLEHVSSTTSMEVLANSTMIQSSSHSNLALDIMLQVLMSFRKLIFLNGKSLAAVE
nr:uncharacterized protein LOC109422451 [Aedes albopictus]